MKNLKKYLILLSLPLAFSFLLFMHEPIVMYAGNIGDFWFDFGVLIEQSAPLFLLSFLFLSAFFILLKKFKIKILLNIFYISLFAIFLIFYIHSNFLAGFLPGLDGSTIDWNNTIASVVSIAVCCIVVIGVIASMIKLKSSKTLKISSYVSLAIFAMLFVSMISVITTKPVLRSKSDYVIATDRGINRLSKKENFLILMLDAVDSRDFYNVIKDNEYEELLKDFTYYPDTMGAYTQTRESVPYIFSSELFKNEEPFYQYSTRSFSNSKILNKMNDEGFERYIFDNDFVLEDADIASKFKNLKVNGLPKANKVEFIKQETKFLLFRILPYPLKRFSFIKSMDFERAKEQLDTNDALFYWHNNYYKYNYLTLENDYTEDKLFQFLHLEGGHVPFNHDENLDYFDTDYDTDDPKGYELKLKGTANVVKMYLQRLKDSDAYDNSVIVIIADHGYDVREGNPLGRANPILFVKGKNETHHKMQTSAKQIYQGDFEDAFIELADGAKSTDIFKNIPEKDRERIFMSYHFIDENHMTEYIQRYHAWDKDKFEATGKKFEQDERW